MPKKRKPLSRFLQAYYDLIKENSDNEYWKDIKLGDDPLYQISNLGRVRRKDTKYTINPFHSYRKNDDGSYNKNRPTYLRVQLYYYENGKRKKKHFEISRLVAIHFIPVPKKYIKKGYIINDLEVNHIKGGWNIYNNMVSNLEWCTTQENIEKAFETDLRHPKKGNEHHATFVNEDDVIEICKFIESGKNVKDTYNNIKLSVDVDFDKFKPLYYNIKYKKSWVYISQHFNF